LAKETIASMAVRIGIDLSDFDKNMKEFQRTWGKLGSQMQQYGTQIGMAFTGAGAAVGAGLGVAVNKAMDFDAQMSRVSAIAGATGDDLQKMRQAALDLGASTSKSATEVANGMELMAAKGYDASQVIAAMPGVIAAAEASGEDMALVADTVASALNAFGMEAGDATKVADVLAKSANTSAAGVGDLQYAFKYAAPVAKSLGISMEQLSAATGIMADNGMKGEQAGTTLRAALLRMADPSKEAKKAMDALGLSVTDAQGNFLPFDQIIGQLSMSTANMTNAQKAASLSTIFGTEAMSGMLSLVEAGPEKFRLLTTELENSAGTSATAAAQMKDNLAGAMEELTGAFETMQITIGSALAPAIETVAGWLQKLADWFNQLSPSTQQFIAIGAALSAGLMILIGVVGFLVAGLGALAAAQWAVILPIMGVVAAVAAVVAALIGLGVWVTHLYKENEAFRDKVNAAWAAIKAFIMPLVNEVVTYLRNTFGEFAAYWNQIWPDMKEALMNVWKLIWVFLEPQVKMIVGYLTVSWEIVKSVTLALWEMIKDGIDAVLRIIKGIIEVFIGVFTGDWERAWNGVKEIVLGVWDGIVGGIKGAVNLVIAAINGMIRGMNKISFSIPDWVPNIGGKSWGFNLPEIPMLAAGGLVTGPTLSMIGEAGPEAVIPLDRLHEFGGASEGGPMTVVFEMDSRQIAKKVFEQQGGIFRVRGVVT
jgi:TP901 family phage tail tape measure protein